MLIALIFGIGLGVLIANRLDKLWMDELAKNAFKKEAEKIIYITMVHPKSEEDAEEIREILVDKLFEFNHNQN